MNRGLAAAGVAFAIAAVCAPASLDAQTRRSTPTPPRPPAASAVRTEAAKVNCPQVLGDGVRTKRQRRDEQIAETAVRAGRMDYEGAGRLLRFYEDGLHGYTYLEG